MSGRTDRAHIPGTGMAHLIRAAARLSETNLGRYAIIGGVAVNARVGRAHRATLDLDAVIDEQAVPNVLEILTAIDEAAATVKPPHRIVLEGTNVDIIATAALPPGSLEGLSIDDTLFLGSHRWALESAEPMTLAGDDGCEARVPIAIPSALVAMKLCAIRSRRVTGVDKRSGDAWDIVQLLGGMLANGEVESGLETAPLALRTAMITAVDSVLIGGSARTIGWLKSGDDLMRAVTPDELMFLGETLSAVLRERS